MGTEAVRRLRQRRAAAGLCTYCGNQPPDRGVTKRCSVCIATSRAYTIATRRKHAQEREQRAAAGLCVCCGKRRADHGKRCSQCATRDNLQHRQWLAQTTAQRKAAGLCKSCGLRPIAARSVSRCVECLQKESKSTPAKLLRNRENARKWYKQLRQRVIAHYSGGKNCCACCGEPELGFLTIDHANDNGGHHRILLGGGGVKLFRYLIKNDFPPGFQVLCFNCNLGRARNGGVCPHQTHQNR